MLNFAVKSVVKNVAIMWYIINETPLSDEMTEMQIIYATALIDSYVYLANGQLDINDIILAVNNSQKISESTNYYDKLVELSIWLIAIFDYALGGNSLPISLVNSTKKRKIVCKYISKMLNKNIRTKHYKRLFPIVIRHLSDTHFRNIVFSYNDSVINS